MTSHLLWLMIEDDEVAVLEIVAVELVASLFCVYDIFVNDECGALCVVGDALADLTDNSLAGCRGAIRKSD